VAAEREEVVFDADPVHPSSSFQIASSRSSAALRAATSDRPLSGKPPGAALGAGSRRRSTLPFGVIGRASSSTKADGIM
jgi:hypothetical protein